MSLVEILVLAAVQGITEFLPISSSAHLILLPALFGWTDQGVTFDIAVHVGTLAAVVVYFRGDVTMLAFGAVDLVRLRWTTAARLTLWVGVASVPIVIAGLAVHASDPGWMRSVEVIAWATIGFGILLYLADRFAPEDRPLARAGWRTAIVVGLAQVLALIPGTSRSGITMTAARALGLRRDEAARFSLLLSIPTILGAGVLAARDLAQSGDIALGRDALLGAVLSFAFALAAIAGLMAWLRRAGFAPFVLYRLALGGGLLVWVYA